jgi:hypothetical protein
MTLCDDLQEYNVHEFVRLFVRAARANLRIGRARPGIGLRKAGLPE